MSTILEQLPQLALEAFTLGHAVPRFLGRVIDAQAQRPLERHVLEPAKQWLQERFRRIRSSNRGHDSSPVQLPQNHHLERAYLRAWQQAVRMLKDAIGLRLKPEQRKAPLADQAQFEWWDKFDELTAFASDDDRIKFEPPESDAFRKPPTLSESFQAFVEQVLLDQRQLALLVDDSADGDVGLRRQIQFLDWTRNQISQEGEPKIFEDFLRNGIPVELLSNERLMLWQLIQYFFQDDLKHDSPAFLGYVARMLATLITRPNESKLSDEGKKELSEEIEKLAEKYEDALTPVLTESFDRLRQEIQPLHKKLDAFLQELAKQTQTLEEVKATGDDTNVTLHSLDKKLGDWFGTSRTTGDSQSPESGEKAIPGRQVHVLQAAEPICVAREEEIQRLEQDWGRDQPLSVCVKGGPGLGKSTISLKTLYRPAIVRRYGDRRFYVRCDGIRSRIGLVGELIDQLGLPRNPNATDAYNAASVLEELSRQPTALVLDNVEVMWNSDDRTAVEEFFGLLASRERQAQGLAFGIAIRGHETPAHVAWGEVCDLRRLTTEQSQEVFLSHIVSVAQQENFKNDPDLKVLLSSMDGLPLALFLLAKVADVETSLKPVLRQWQRIHAKLLTRPGMKQDRNTDLHVSLEVSLRDRRLSDPKDKKQGLASRRALAMLSILPDGAEWIDLELLLGEEVDSALAALKQLGLVYEEADRLRMLAPIRDVCLEKYQQPFRKFLAEVHSHYFYLAINSTPRIGNVGAAEALKWLTANYGNIETLLTNDLRAAPTALAIFNDLCDAPTALALAIVVACSLRWFAKMTGLASQQLMNAAHKAAIQLEDQTLEASCLWGMADTALSRSQHADAETHYAAALKLYQQVGNSDGEAGCLRGMAESALSRSQHADAETHYAAALKLYQQVGNSHGEAGCRLGMGRLAVERKQFDQAASLLDQALKHHCHVNDADREAADRCALGWLALQQANHDLAQSHFAAALQIFQNTNDICGAADSRRGLGEVARQQGNLTEAQQQFTAVLAIVERIPNPHEIGLCHQGLARIASHPDDRRSHATAARTAWLSINRPDLVQQLDKEFGPA